MATSNPSLTQTSSPPEDPFDSLLTLEDTLYTSAYTLGTNAGSLAGRIEGRIFGLENGFEKFAVLGALHGRGVVWASRLPSLATSTSTSPSTSTQKSPPTTTNTTTTTTKTTTPTPSSLPPLQETPRLKSNTTLLHALTDPPTFSTSNTEEAVADYDDRSKRASAKAKVIERIVGENVTSTSSSTSSTTQNMFVDDVDDVKHDDDKRVENNDATKPKTLQPAKIKISAQQRKKTTTDDNMEDFTGSPFLR